MKNKVFPSDTLAVIDIGSNSVRMVIYDLSHTPPDKIFNEKAICSLGKDLGITGKLNPEATVSAFKALTAYKLLSEVYHVAHMEVVGTASLRDAADGSDFIIGVQNKIGLDIRIISGDEEATYAAHGVMMFDPDADGVVADFGGGSMELARVYSQHVHDTISLPMGAFRVQSMGENATSSIAAFLKPLQSRFGELKNLYAIGGSWRVLSSAHMKYAGKKSDLEGYSIPAKEMISFCRLVQDTSEILLRSTYKMEIHHVKLSHVAAFTLEKTLEILEPKNFVVSTAGVRDGVVHEFLLTQAKTR